MAADEKSTLKLFFDCRLHTLHTRVPTQKLNEMFTYIKYHTKICRWYLHVVILKIDIKYPFLVRFHIFSRNDRLFTDQCDVIARANMENCYQNSSWGKCLIKSRNNESYSFIYNLSIFQAKFCPYHTYSFKTYLHFSNCHYC